MIENPFATFLVWIIRHLPRNLAIYLGLRRLSPERGIAPWAAHTYTVPGDTGGGWRPKFRPQDPSKDPQEPYSNDESSSKAQEHGWNNCTLSAGALALAYEQHQQSGKWGGDLRHHQSDREGGTDLYDLQDAWAAYGEEFKIKTGQGWDYLKSKHNEDRPIVIQGTGQCPGQGTFTGAHACIIGPETHSSGDWLWGDTLTNDWQFVPPSKIRDWAERYHSGIAFGVGSQFAIEPEPEPPEPEPEPEPPIPEPPTPPPPSYSAVGWMPVPAAFGVWDIVKWDDGEWVIDESIWSGQWA